MKKGILWFCFSLLSIPSFAQLDESGWAIKIMPLAYFDVTSNFQAGVARNFNSGRTLELDCGIHYFDGPLYGKRFQYRHSSDAIKLKLSLDNPTNNENVYFHQTFEWIYFKTLSSYGIYVYDRNTIREFDTGVIEQNVFIFDPIGITTNIYSRNKFYIESFLSAGIRFNFSGLYDFGELRDANLGVESYYVTDHPPSWNKAGWLVNPDLQLGLRFCFQFKHRA